MTLTFPSYLKNIENYKPGKSKIINQGSENKKIIKLSSNENALGACKKAIESFKNHFDKLHIYADGSCFELRKKIAEKNNIDENRIVCGAGSDEIIALITSIFASKNDEVIYSEYGFLMYPISAQRVGAKPVSAKEENLKTNINSILSAISEKTKIIFIANPNNPTGSYLNKNEINQLIEKTPKNIAIVIDNAYQEFVDCDDYPNAIDLVNQNNNVIMTRTFSKIFGLASLRIGWSYSSIEIAEILNKVRGPFNVSGAAQEAAIASLEDDEFLINSKNHNSKWLKIFNEELAKNDKIICHPSVANFVLLDFKTIENCQKANELFLQNHIIVREMTPYKLPTCLRISIGKDDENNKVLEVLRKYHSL
jgi:histidinol-phosphate aminotransferase